MRTALGVLLTIGVLGGCASTAEGSGDRTPRPTASASATARPVAAQPRTADRALTVFHANGSRAIAAGRTTSGTCFTGSVAAPVDGAYRCFSGNAILDPCVAPSGVAEPDSLVCVADPWSKATVLRLTAPLPTGDPIASVTRPWAMQLAGGIRCTAATGTVAVVGHVALLYTCAGGGSAGIPSPAEDGVQHAAYLAPHATRAVSTAVADTWTV